MNIHIFNSQTALKISKRQVKQIVNEVLHLERVTCDEVTISFVSPRRICQLHDLYFQDPSLTDCISFPIDDEQQQGYRVLGEVFVCPQTAVQYASRHHKDPYLETTLYVVHGLLHLLGHDDMDQRKRRKMKTAEKRHLRHLQELNLMLCNRANPNEWGGKN